MEHFWYCAYWDDKKHTEAYIPCDERGEAILPSEYGEDQLDISLLFTKLLLDDFNNVDITNASWDDFYIFCENNIYQGQEGSLFRRDKTQSSFLLIVPIDINKLNLIEEELQQFSISIIDKFK